MHRTSSAIVARIAHRPRIASLAVAGLLAAAAATAPAAARDPIVIEVTGEPDTVVVSGSDLLDILEDAIESRGAFAGFDGTAFTASAAVGGVSDVIRVAVNAAGTSATLEFPLTGFSRTFTGANTDEIQEQIEDFIEDDGADEYALVVEALNERSVMAVVDGNPGSATARIGRATFRRWGLSPYWAPGLTVSGTEAQDDDSFRFSLDPGAEVLDRDGFDSVAGTLGASATWALNDAVGLSLSGLAVYEEVEDASLFQGGIELALPITLLGVRGDEVRDPNADADGNGAADGGAPGVRADTAPPVRLQLTPYAGYGLGGSVDLGQGASFWSLGVAASAAMEVGPVTLSGGAAITHFGGVDLSYDDYEFETEIDQQLLTVGGLASWHLGDGVSVSGGVSWSQYLQDAAIDDWISPEVGVTFGGPRFQARVGWIGTFGDDVDGHAGHVGLHWRF